MRAFVDGKVSKPELLEALAEHREQDRIVAGHYGIRKGAPFQFGCAVGCTIASFRRRFSRDRSGSRYHSQYETLFSIPESVAYIEDSIFEGLAWNNDPEDAPVVRDKHGGEYRLARGPALEWPERFVNAITPGADLRGVADRFYDIPDVDLIGSPARADRLIRLLEEAPVPQL